MKRSTSQLATDEHAKAAWWRLNVAQLTPRRLSELTGFSERSVYYFEAGGGIGRALTAGAWLRYKSACAGVDAQLRARKAFDWGVSGKKNADEVRP